MQGEERRPAGLDRILSKEERLLTWSSFLVFILQGRDCGVFSWEGWTWV